MIKENLAIVRKNIEDACKKAGRDPKEITLIAVSKTKPVEMMEECMREGQMDFGENKVQEIVRKEKDLPPDVHWHMIGHLQRNKVKQVVGRVTLIHSVDSLRLAEAISQEAVKQAIKAKILLQVNVAGEDSKFGSSYEEALALTEAVSHLENIEIQGFMTIAPFVEDPEENRPVFRKLKELSVDIASKNMNNVNIHILSMGMTGDYQVAIEEGATMIRVGTGIFGARDYNRR